MECRFCKEKLDHEFIDLIGAPPSNSFLTKDQLNQPEKYFPLKVLVCTKCFLVQIDEYKSSRNIFNNEYVYFSSYSTTWLNHAEKYVGLVVDRFKLDRESKVVEIASNDGYLLQYFVKKGIPVLGIEPTDNTAQVAISKGIPTKVDFFGTGLARTLADQGHSADLLLGNNVLAHVPDINDFVGGLKIALKQSGIITMEFPHLLRLVRHNQFDTIYHEHFSYLSLLTVKSIFNRHGLEIFDVEEIPTHGGSLRIFAKHIDNTKHLVLPSVANLIKSEIVFGMNSLSFYQGFQQKVDDIKNQFLEFLLQAKKERKKVAGYGAAAKGNTLLNYCGVRKDLIDFVVDANPYKQNKYLPGSHIPVVDEQLLKSSSPDYVVIFPWNIKEELISQLTYIKDWGGKFVIAIPHLQLL